MGAKLAEQFQTVVPTTATRCLENVRFRVVDAEQVCKLLKGLSTNKAQGMDKIPAKILKIAATELAFPLATIFNYSLMTGTIPGKWKCGKVTAIFVQVLYVNHNYTFGVELVLILMPLISTRRTLIPHGSVSTSS